MDEIEINEEHLIWFKTDQLQSRVVLSLAVEVNYILNVRTQDVCNRVVIWQMCWAILFPVYVRS